MGISSKYILCIYELKNKLNCIFILFHFLKGILKQSFQGRKKKRIPIWIVKEKAAVRAKIVN